MTIFGIDISNNNGVVDIQRVKDEGFSFVFAKVSEGAGFRDFYWGRTREWCRSLGMIVAGYHYVKTDDPNRQADLFVSQLGDNSIPAMLDFEAGSGNIDNFWAVLNAIQARGVHVALSYIPRWYWSQIGAPDISGVPGLIQSSYVSAGGTAASALYPGDGTFYWSGFGGRSVDILQFTDRAIVAGQSLDANAYAGTPDQLRALLGGTVGTGWLMSLSDAEQVELLNGVRLIVAQLLGEPDPGRPGVATGWPQLDNDTVVNALAYVKRQLKPWPQLGQNAAGEDLTPVDALAEVKKKVVGK